MFEHAVYLKNLRSDRTKWFFFFCEFFVWFIVTVFAAVCGAAAPRRVSDAGLQGRAGSYSRRQARPIVLAAWRGW